MWAGAPPEASVQKARSRARGRRPHEALWKSPPHRRRPRRACAARCVAASRSERGPVSGPQSPDARSARAGRSSARSSAQRFVGVMPHARGPPPGAEPRRPGRASVYGRPGRRPHPVCRRRRGHAARAPSPTRDAEAESRPRLPGSASRTRCRPPPGQRAAHHGRGSAPPPRCRRRGAAQPRAPRRPEARDDGAARCAGCQWRCRVQLAQLLSGRTPREPSAPGGGVWSWLHGPTPAAPGVKGTARDGLRRCSATAWRPCWSNASGRAERRPSAWRSRRPSAVLSGPASGRS